MSRAWERWLPFLLPHRGERARLAELRRHRRLLIRSRVELRWDVGGEKRRAVGRCVDISEGGAKIEVSDPIPVASSVHIRFLEDLNLEARAVVRGSRERGTIGIQFQELIWCGSPIRRRRVPLYLSIAMPVTILAGVTLLLILLPSLRPHWKWSPSNGALGTTPSSPAAFTLGATAAEVTTAQGHPTARTESVWHYGSSRVYFRDDRVIGWSSSPEAPLHVGPGTASSERSLNATRRFAVGSPASEVLAAQGPPTELDGDVWRYGESEVHFRDGRVVGWKTSPGQPLKTTRNQ